MPLAAIGITSEVGAVVTDLVTVSFGSVLSVPACAALASAIRLSALARLITPDGFLRVHIIL